MVSIVPGQKMYEQARTSSNRAKSSKGQISPQTLQTTPFPSGCSLLMRIQDDWYRVIKASARPRAWLLIGWTRSFSAAGWSVNSGCDFSSIFDELSFVRSTLHGRPSNDQGQPESSSQWFAYPYFCPWWPVAPGRRPEHPPSLDGHCLGTAVFLPF